MHVLTVADAKKDFSRGFVKAFKIDRAPLASNWFVSLSVSGQWSLIADARTKTPRAFKSIDSAVSTLEGIGFKIDLLK